MLRVDRLELDGYQDNVSPIRLDGAGFDLRGGSKRYRFIESDDAPGGTLMERPQREMVEREVPVFIYPRFTEALVNRCGNPLPEVTTGWQTQGAGATLVDELAKMDPCLAFMTTGSANSGGGVGFAATAAPWSGGIWVKAETGAPLRILFDGETGTAFTATGEWQYVLTENVTLTAGPTRWLNVVQTDTGTRTIRLRRCMLFLGAQIPRDDQGRSLYWDYTSGDAFRNADGHSQAIPGVDGILATLGALGKTFDRAESTPEDESVTLVQRPYGATHLNEIVLVGGEVKDVLEDQHLAAGQRASVSLRLLLRPEVLGEETHLGTFHKTAAEPMLEAVVRNVPGQIAGPARLEVKSIGGGDQRYLAGGMQRRTATDEPIGVLRVEMLDTDTIGTHTLPVTEVQRATKTGTLSSGTWKIQAILPGVGAVELGPFANNASIATVGGAFAPFGVTVGGSPISLGNMTFEFTAWPGLDIPLMTWVNIDIGGGGTAPITTTTTPVRSKVDATLPAGRRVSIATSGSLPDAGDYRIQARVSAPEATNFRLAWSVGGGAVARNHRHIAVPAVAGSECLIDLGPVSIPRAKNGSQRWNFWLEAYSETGGAVTAFEALRLPTEVADCDVRTPSDPPPKLVLSDSFDQPAGNYTGRSMPIGGVVSGGGDADDFTIDATGHVLQRTAVSDAANVGRYIHAGAAMAGCRAETWAASQHRAAAGCGLFLRYVDASNYVFARINLAAIPPVGVWMSLHKKVAGTVTQIGSAPHLWVTDSPVEMFAELRVDGSFEFGFTAVNTGEVRKASGVDSDLATGGPLASGKCGIYDEWTSGSANTRKYDDFSASALPIPSYVIPQGGPRLLLTPEATALREVEANVFGEANAAIPNPPRLYPGTNRIALVSSRFVPDAGPDLVRDPLTLDVYHRPAFEVHEG